jgi:uncharacterized protein involved in response to NO
MTDAQTQRTEDRSVLRRLRAGGDRMRDGRGCIASMPPILQYGFRPFFFLAALYAGLAVPTWLALYQTGIEPPGPLHGMVWHAHEMLFGYLAAVIAGFILTAVPNWTGRLPLSGWPLAGLVVLWLAGRAATALVADPAAAMAVDLAFPAALATAIWREVSAGRNWRNAPVAAMLTLFGLANAAHHLQGFGLVPEGLGARLAPSCHGLQCRKRKSPGLRCWRRERFSRSGCFAGPARRPGASRSSLFCISAMAGWHFQCCCWALPSSGRLCRKARPSTR